MWGFPSNPSPPWGRGEGEGVSKNKPAHIINTTFDFDFKIYRHIALIELKQIRIGLKHIQMDLALPRNLHSLSALPYQSHIFLHHQ